VDCNIIEALIHVRRLHTVPVFFNEALVSLNTSSVSLEFLINETSRCSRAQLSVTILNIGVGHIPIVMQGITVSAFEQKRFFGICTWFQASIFCSSMLIRYTFPSHGRAIRMRASIREVPKPLGPKETFWSKTLSIQMVSILLKELKKVFLCSGQITKRSGKAHRELIGSHTFRLLFNIDHKEDRKDNLLRLKIIWPWDLNFQRAKVRNYWVNLITEMTFFELTLEITAHFYHLYQLVTTIEQA